MNSTFRLSRFGAPLLLLFFAFNARAGEVVSFQDEVSGLAFGATIALNEEQTNEQAAAIFSEVKAELARLAKAFESPLSFQIEPIALSAEQYALLATMLGFSKELEGSIDPTLGVLEDVYAFSNTKGELPEADKVKQAAAYVGLDKIALDASTRSLRILQEGTRVDFRRVLKGYALDQGAEQLRKGGFVNFLLHLDGQVLAIGKKHEQEWALGVRDPRGNTPFATFEFAGAVRTRSDAERFLLTNDSKRVSDVIDPRSLRPVGHIRSLTVLAPDATTAELLSQALFVLGVKKALRYCERNAGVSVIIVDDKNKVFVSKSIEKSVRLQSPSAGR